jgi:DNA end-binding protein Ku
MRAIWKGAVSFGLVSIAVKLYSATEEKDIRFHQVHRADGGRVKYQRICSIDGQQITYDQVAKGYDVGGGEIVMLTDEDLADLPLTSSHAIEVLEFVPTEQIDPILYHKAYYLEPDGALGAKPYLLMREALLHTDRVAVVKVALRQRETLATVRVRDGVLVLNTMLWPDEVRRPDFDFLIDEAEGAGAAKLRSQEIKMAASLVESMAGDFDPDEFTDSYREALQQVIEVKLGDREVVTPPEIEAATEVSGDLMAALRASVDRARAARGSGSPAGGSTDRPAGRTAPAGKAAGRKAPPKKATAAKKATAPAAAKKAGTKQAGTKQTGTKQTSAKAAGKATGKDATVHPIKRSQRKAA